MTESEFNRLAAAGYNRVPLVLETYADLDTPLSIYLKLANQPQTYLLESVVGGERGSGGGRRGDHGAGGADQRRLDGAGVARSARPAGRQHAGRQLADVPGPQAGIIRLKPDTTFDVASACWRT